MIGTFYYTSKDQLAKDIKETIGEVNLDVSEGSAQRLANAQKIDTLARAINGLTTNTYQNSFVEYSFSINDVLAEGAAQG